MENTLSALQVRLFETQKSSLVCFQSALQPEASVATEVCLLWTSSMND